MALLDRYSNAKTTIKRLTTEKEEAELKAVAIHAIKEENARLRTQRAGDVEELSKLNAEKINIESRLKFTLNVNKDLEAQLHALRQENERLKKTAAAQTERHTLHIPCVCGIIPMKPEINESGAPLSVCYADERNGVVCHHIALDRVAGRLSATALSIQKRAIPDELIASARRGSI